ncbi:Uncharacterized protein TPAR_00024 [Tolypocladium paradoxum]|uniref:Uncharacterized protein n=1 Tax=Tolypocladium paradoxum TaxID=94208 RepID=A0A2S4LBJ3_9HYPO|nr:Uncharacterized protein TPAR_00024 [Tolypocladium paradoxum]
MASPRGFAEFYVSCNPPLLPKGVAFVVEATAEAFTNVRRSTECFRKPATNADAQNEVIELLYEPDIPWFKAITDRVHQKPVTEFIQRLLTTIVEKDSDLLGIDRSNQARNRGYDAPVDVKVVGSDSRVLPWSRLQNEVDIDEGWFDAHRFPCNMQDIKHRAVWRGLESMDGWTVDYFFDLLESEWKHAGAPTCITELEELVQCQISYNLAANLVYVGSKQLHLGVIEKALKTLDSLLRITVYGHHRREHLILTEGPGPFQIVYKWLSHIGQDKTTYVHGNKDRIGEEYGRLRTAVTLRTQRQLANNLWDTDGTKYPFKGGLKPGAAKVFTPFDGYKYPKKHPAAVHSLFKKVLEAQKADMQESKNLDDSGRNNADVPGDEPPPLALESMASLVMPYQPRDASSDTHPGPQPEQLASPGDTVAVTGELATAIPSDTLIPVESGNHHAPKGFVETWRDAVERAAPEQLGEPWQPSGPQQSLFFFDEPDEKTLGSELGAESDLLAAVFQGIGMSSGSHTQPTSESRDQFKQSEDLICLDHEPQTGAPHHSSAETQELGLLDVNIAPGQQPQQPAISPQRANRLLGHLQGHFTTRKQHLSLLDTDNPPIVPTVSSVMTKANCAAQGASVGYNEPNDAGEKLVDFGVRLEAPKDCRQTMNQRAGRDESRLVKTNSTPESQTLPADVLGSVAKRANAAAGSLAATRGAAIDGCELQSVKTLVLKAATSSGQAESLSARKSEPLLYSGADKASTRQPLTRSGLAQELPSFPDPKATTVGKAVVPKPSDLRAGKAPSSTKSAMLTLTEARVKALASVLQLMPGNVSIDLNFGRFYLKDLSHSQVDVGAGPHWTIADILESLNANELPPQCLGFSTMLSTCGPDVDDLVEIQPPEEEKWSLCNTRVLYEFTCSMQGAGEFVVEVDSQTLEYGCRGLKEDLGHLYLHCVQRPWDLQVCVSRSTCLTKSPKHMAIGEALLASICVGTDKGEVVVETTTDERLGATVDSVKIRHVAQYRHQETGGSMLSLTMVKRLVPAGKQAKRMKWSVTRQHTKGAPYLFYEASVSSVRAEELFAENRDMRLGEETTWDCDKLEREGVFEDLCRRAFGMVTQMNHIGLLNDNGLGMKGMDAFNDSLAEAKERGRNDKFW